MSTPNVIKASEIREKRLRYGITQEELAHEANIALLTVNRLEKCPEGRKKSTIIKVAAALERLISNKPVAEI